MVRTGSLFSQILSLFQRPDFVGHVRALKAVETFAQVTRFHRHKHLEAAGKT